MYTNQSINTKSSKYSRLFTIFMCLMPFLNIYGTHMIPALRIGEVVMLIVICYIFLFRQKINIYNDNKFYWIAIIYIIGISFILTVVINTYSISDTTIRVFRVLFYTFLALNMSKTYFDIDIGERLYVVLSTVASLIVLIQFLILQVSGEYITFILPKMNLSTNHDTSEQYFAQIAHDLMWYGKSTRPSGVFLEPSHFCEYAIFSLVFLLFSDKIKKNKLLMILINTIAIVISGSAIGYFGLLVIFFIWLIEQMCGNKVNAKIFILGIIGVILIVIFSVKFNLWSNAIWRLMTINSTESSTGNLRILRGFVIFSKMPFLYKIIGMGIGNFGAFIEKYNIVTYFDATLNRTNEFMNTISVILVSGGIVGLCLYIFAIFNIFRKANRIQRVFFWVLMVFLLTSNNFYKESYMFTIIFMTITNNKEEKSNDR